jgi:hypothetical protein
MKYNRNIPSPSFPVSINKFFTHEPESYTETFKPPCYRKQHHVIIPQHVIVRKRFPELNIFYLNSQSVTPRKYSLGYMSETEESQNKLRSLSPSRMKLPKFLPTNSQNARKILERKISGSEKYSNDILKSVRLKELKESVRRRIYGEFRLGGRKQWIDQQRVYLNSENAFSSFYKAERAQFKSLKSRKVKLRKASISSKLDKKLTMK